MKYSIEDRSYDWKVAVGVFAFNFVVINLALSLAQPFSFALSLAICMSSFSMAVTGGFLFFVLPVRDDSKKEKKRGDVAAQILGVLSVFSTGIALSCLLFSIHNYAGYAFILGCLVVIGLIAWYVDDD